MPVLHGFRLGCFNLYTTDVLWYNKDFADAAADSETGHGVEVVAGKANDEGSHSVDARGLVTTWNSHQACCLL